ncbi:MULTISPECIES: protein-export chaperone SecB [Limnobacter]|uniref:Protein-export protein SecB n=1 Tax=Limnobacter litoralis TaxID=481366 RepID=A0ABQ5YPU9_9BURK|nr:MULTISPECIES: protein-export chaperone SecB [Limnobacter]GLR25256.1 protein-export protein SecB [Limnobacter litoralis]HEX5486243.1 protein-export chaperone SecB [Limnobacter sp.]
MSEQAQEAVFQMQRVYLKDASLEMPNAPQAFLEKSNPQIEVSVDVGAQRLGETVFESEVTVTVTAKVEDRVSFLVEAKQAGIFEISGVPEEQYDPLLGILCPNMIYPYLRANVADLITRTGFPPVHLSDINFEQFYQQRLAAAQEQANQA